MKIYAPVIESVVRIGGQFIEITVANNIVGLGVTTWLNGMDAGNYIKTML